MDREEWPSVSVRTDALRYQHLSSGVNLLSTRSL